MDMHELTRSLAAKNDSKIVMFVADGLGGAAADCPCRRRSDGGAEAAVSVALQY